MPKDRNLPRKSGFVCIDARGNTVLRELTPGSNMTITNKDGRKGDPNFESTASGGLAGDRIASVYKGKVRWSAHTAASGDNIVATISTSTGASIAANDVLVARATFQIERQYPGSVDGYTGWYFKITTGAGQTLAPNSSTIRLGRNEDAKLMQTCEAECDIAGGAIGSGEITVKFYQSVGTSLKMNDGIFTIDVYRNP